MAYCLWCGSNKVKVVNKRIDDVKVLKCDVCNLMQVESTKYIYDKYDKEYFQSNDKRIGYIDYKNRDYISFIWQYALLENLINKQEIEVLDIGCAYGGFIDFLSSKGIKSYGVEISKEAYEQCKSKKLNVYLGKLQELKLVNKFDVITAWDMIEHESDLKNFFFEVKRLLKKNAYFMFSTPDGSDFYTEEGKEWIGFKTSLEHILYFSKDSLQKILYEVFGDNFKLFSISYGEYKTIFGCAKNGNFDENEIFGLDVHEGIDLYKKINIATVMSCFEKYKDALKILNCVEKYSDNKEYINQVKIIKSYIYNKQILNDEALKELESIQYENLNNAIYWQLLNKVKNDINDYYKKQLYDEVIKNKALLRDNKKYIIQSNKDYKYIEFLKEQINKKQYELNSILWSKEWEYLCKIKRIKNCIIHPKRSVLKFGKKIIPTNIKKIIKKHILKNKLSIDTYDEPDKFKILIENFLNDRNINEIESIMIIFSGVKFMENEGQRAIRLASEALRKNISIIFCYWTWSKNEYVEQLNLPNIINIPIDILQKNKEFILDYKFNYDINKMFLIEFPHPSVLEIISNANCSGWNTMYDVIDDWEEFSKRGQAVWYNKDIEKYIANNSDCVITTSKALNEKVSHYITKEKKINVVHNAVNPRLLKYICNKDVLNDECIDVGYFGHLTEAWFDWKMILEIAIEKPKWKFHIIGYGEPKDLVVPKNIIMYGKVNHEDLPKYTSKWDVAIIPFKNNKLTESVDPIKVYEYLYLKVPVVASNMPDLKSYPYTQIAINKVEFCNSIIQASKIKIDESIINEFIKNNTWEKRFTEIENLFNSEKVVKKLLFYK